MIDLITLAKGKLDDSILMPWALDRYRQARPGSRAAMERAWFDDLTLRRWLASDDQDTLERLFSELPAERFANLGQAIGECWGRWTGRLAYHAALVLARFEPDLAEQCFASPGGQRQPDAYIVLGMIQALPLLPPESARSLLGVIVAQVLAAPPGGTTRDVMLSGLMLVALKIDRQVGQKVIRECLMDTDDARSLHTTFNGVAVGLSGYSRYQQLATEIRSGETQQRFLPLAALFRDDAPLERLDQWSCGQVTLSDLTGLIDEFCEDDDRSVILALIETLKARGIAKNWNMVAGFLIGTIASACERKELDTSGMSLQQVVGFVSANLSTLPHFEPLLARLKGFDPDEVFAVLVPTLEREKVTCGGVSIAQVMGRLGRGVFVPSLIDAMCETGGEFLCEAARDALISIGEPARDQLTHRWDKLDSSQRIYGLSVIEAVGGDPAATFAFDRHHEFLHDDRESWCRLVAAVPDRRLLDLVEQQMPRDQGLFDETFYPIARLLDPDHPQLDAVGDRIRRRKAEQHASRAALERGDRFQGSLDLELRCPVCDDVSEYQVQRVAISSQLGSTMLLGQEIACASCGQWTDLELTTEAKLAVTAELARLVVNGDAEPVWRSKLLIRAVAPLDGRLQPVVAVLSHCQGVVDKDPGSVRDWMKLAYCYHQVLFRPRFGMTYSDRVLSLDPNAVEAVILKADALVIEGNGEQAFELLDQALASKHRWHFLLADVAKPAEIAAQFALLYNDLLRRLGRTDRGNLPASFFAASKKPGRNDPCPCGSGKKYKKCCLL